MNTYALDNIGPSFPDGFHWIAANATVVGNVTIESNVSIWFGSVLRGDNDPIAVGAGTNIQDLCMVHSDPGFPVNIGAGCTIGHRAIIHGCTIGNNTLIGMGAIVLNGAVIGENCIVGAGALVREREHVPDNSLFVGSPGKVIKTISADAEAGLRRSAAHYVQNALRFSRALAAAANK
ncbi:Isoleucine patch superfamily enzyme, carbonic anhydrase/acetyltransferase [Neorhizobium galegae bv. officinalis]|nr:Isoleucine patch superfamily enzyme, carbonic anhydrase/acetyltransferase [Neorhizobium galegae bv. officinalis]